MKTIKFRYVYQHQETGRITSECYTLIEIEREHLQRSQLFVFVDRWQIIARDQFTGASDKHGTEMYEGDIIKYGDTVGTIKWSVDDAKFYISAHAQNTEFNNGIWRLSIGRDSHLIEVIGNIYANRPSFAYDNPELLEE